MEMVLATVMVMTTKVLAITVVMVVNISKISKGDARDCLFARTDYIEETCRNAYANYESHITSYLRGLVFLIKTTKNKR